MRNLKMPKRGLPKHSPVNPRFAEGHQKMAATKFKLGKVKEALEHYGLAVEIDPQNKTVHNDFGCGTHGDRTTWQGGSLLSAMHCGSILIMPMQTTTLELHIYTSGKPKMQRSILKRPWQPNRNTLKNSRN